MLAAGCGKDKKGDDPPPPTPSPAITRFFPIADTIGATITIYGAQYDPGNDKWTQKLDVPSYLYYVATAFGIGNKGYMSCGTYGFVPKKDLWE